MTEYQLKYDNYQLYYDDSLEQAHEYQDFVCDKLRKADPCLIIGPYSSRKYQYEKSESFSGIEIKNDRRLAGNDEDLKPTHNLYIEVAEKSKPENPNYVNSGIFRKDNGWLFLVGNYEEVFLFCTKQLRRMYMNTQYYDLHGVKLITTPTSKGFIIPRQKVLDSPYLLYHWVFDEEAVKKHHPGQKIKGDV